MSPFRMSRRISLPRRVSDGLRIAAAEDLPLRTRSLVVVGTYALSGVIGGAEYTVSWNQGGGAARLEAAEVPGPAPVRHVVIPRGA